MSTQTRANTRLTNRETDQINGQLQKCLKLFFEERKKTCTLVKGEIVPSEPDLLHQLYTNVNANWKKFCTIWNKTGGHTVKADHLAVAKYIDQFCGEELRQVWTDELKDAVENLFNYKGYTDADYTGKLTVKSNEKGVATASKQAGEAAIEMIAEVLRTKESTETLSKTVEVPAPAKKERFIEFLKRCNSVLLTRREVIVPEHNFPTGWIAEPAPLKKLD